MMTDLAKWLLELVTAVFVAFWDFCQDVLIAIVTLFLTALLSIISALVPPGFASGGLQSAINAIPSAVWYFASHFQLGACFALIGAGFAFRFSRKAATLFQW